MRNGLLWLFNFLQRTHKMIWYTRQWQPSSATSAPAVFCAFIPFSASP